MSVYRALLERGFAGARLFGITFHDRAAAAESLARGDADVVFIRYNPAHARAREIVFPRATHATHSALFGFKSTIGWLAEPRLIELGLAPHHWRPRVTDYYRFALSSAELDGILCAPQTAAEVDVLADALDAGPLSEKEQRYLLDLAEIDSGRARLRS
jgi:hypothetical protein